MRGFVEGPVSIYFDHKLGLSWRPGRSVRQAGATPFASPGPRFAKGRKVGVDFRTVEEVGIQRRGCVLFFHSCCPFPCRGFQPSECGWAA